MPYLSVKTSINISEEKKNDLQRKIGELISIIPGKNIDNCMTEIEDNLSFYMGGSAKPLLFCEVRLLTVAPVEAKRELFLKLESLFIDELQVETVYLNYIELNEWGSKGDYRVI